MWSCLSWAKRQPGAPGRWDACGRWPLLVVLALALGAGIELLYGAGLFLRNQENSQRTMSEIQNAPSLICDYINCSSYASPPKSILMWNSYFGMANLGYGATHGANLFEVLGCARTTCLFTQNLSLAPPHVFDALIYHAREPKPLPAHRSPAQRYIFFLLESPAQSGNLTGVDGVFNWTMTYRLDSDIPAVYGDVVALPGTPPISQGWLQPPAPPPQPDAAVDLNETVAPGEHAFVAWMASHCPTQSRREDLVRRLQRHLPVDVYGLCGPLSWPKNDSASFYKMLALKYKFYLSFENSLCRDYVTEKLWKVLGLVVPVVYGGANYSALLPPHSYIDARAFPSERHLAQYLLMLARRPRDYAKFLWWRRHYAIRTHPKSHLCELCAALHDRPPTGAHAQLLRWWGKCQRPTL